MKQKDLVDRLAGDAGISKVQAKAALDSLTSTIAKTLKKEGSIRLSGVGTFQVTKRGARKGRNPRTGEAIKIKATKSVRFRASQTLKGMV